MRDDDMKQLIISDIRRTAQKKLHKQMWLKWRNDSKSQQRFASIDIQDLCKFVMSYTSKECCSFTIKYLCDCLQWDKDNNVEKPTMYQMTCPHDQTIMNAHHFTTCPHLLHSTTRLQLKQQLISLISCQGPIASSWISNTSQSPTTDALSLLCSLFAPNHITDHLTWHDRSQTCIGAFTDARAKSSFKDRLNISNSEQAQHLMHQLRHLLTTSLQEEYLQLVSRIRSLNIAQT